MRWIVEGAWLTALAIARDDQCVAPGGGVSKVNRTVSAISSSRCAAGRRCVARRADRRPGGRQSAGAICRPSSCRPPISCGIALLSLPSAAASTIRARRANICAVRRRFAKSRSGDRSAAVNSMVIARLLIAPPDQQAIVTETYRSAP
jgi:hypothetical protein